MASSQASFDSSPGRDSVRSTTLIHGERSGGGGGGGGAGAGAGGSGRGGSGRPSSAIPIPLPPSSRSGMGGSRVDLPIGMAPAWGPRERDVEAWSRQSAELSRSPVTPGMGVMQFGQQIPYRPPESPVERSDIGHPSFSAVTSSPLLRGHPPSPHMSWQPQAPRPDMPQFRLPPNPRR